MNRIMKTVILALGLGVLWLVLIIGSASKSGRAADHLDAPLVQIDGRIDINDVYAFTLGSNTVIVMTLNPAAGVLSPTTLKPGVRYEFAIDNNGDAVEDLVFRLRVSHPDHGGRQNVILQKAVGAEMLIGHGGTVIASGKSGDTVSVQDGGSLFLGLREDPFFFDLIAFRRGLAFCVPDPAPDFFAGLNVSAIVLEVPTSSLIQSSSNIGVWARTGAGSQQFERMGRPVINTVLIPSGSKDAFNATHPAEDVATWTTAATASLVALNGDPAYSAAVARILLPDILTLDTAAPSGFLNGRALTDDVIDIALTVVSKGAITTDCVDANDKTFLTSFPYLAPPHP